MKQRIAHSRNQRRGAIIVLVLVGVTIAALTSLAMTRRQITRFRFQRQVERDRQAELLMESIRDRVAWRLLSDDNYTGEMVVWQPADSGMNEPAELVVNVETTEREWSVEVVVQYGVEDPHLARRRLDWVITRPQD
jgi:heme/copper-type cytochrome/quinol oxidase subunit 2